MGEKAWEQLVDMIDTKYEIDQHTRKDEPVEGNQHLTRHIEAILFEKDNSKFKIERITSPAVKDTKTHYAHRGAAQRVEQVYDRDETVNRVAFYRQQPDGYWNEVQPESLFTG